MSLDTPKRQSFAQRWQVAVLLSAAVVFATLVGLGTWQIQRLKWKEALIATIDQRIAAPPKPLSEIEALAASTGDVEYWPVSAQGVLLNAQERHFFATFDGKSGFYVYTPLQLADGRILFVNRGFVPYDRKQPATRPESWPQGQVEITGLARNRLVAKPSSMVPENDPAKNIFYWKDLDLMASSAGLPADAKVLPFFVDADKTPNPGGLPIGGVTMVEQPNNHLQYVFTWYGLAAALVAVVGFWLKGRRKRAA